MRCKGSRQGGGQGSGKVGVLGGGGGQVGGLGGGHISPTFYSSESKKGESYIQDMSAPSS